MFSKSRSSTSSYPVQMSAADRTVTIALPTATHPNPAQAAELAAFQYQQELLADFFSGSAAPRPRPPPPASPSGHSHSSHSASSKSKTKWGAVLIDREREAKTKANGNFGFACPLLWLAGVVFLFYPPRPRIEHEGLPVSSAEELGRRVAVYEAAEVRWARCCLLAWVIFMAVVPVVVAAAVLGARVG
ncbi:hypothetical protein LXA43DRAFT_1058538 [Ganoderma leucocontextum]|nr:hypothetical protein LXA43DRAFT_1058538 [Ganoderma leucocontextum]